MKFIFPIAAMSVLFIAVDTGCSLNTDPCPGQQQCSDGTCAPTGYVCCGNGTSCPGGTVCTAYDTCVSSYVSSCLSNGEQTCYNTDGTEDCSPLGSDCCGNHHWCPVGTVCANGGTSCVQ